MVTQSSFDIDDGARTVLKVLSVKQPWASLIVMGLKDVENRTWTTRHRGRLIIHASKSPDRDAMSLFDLDSSQTPSGCLLGSVTVSDVVTDSESDWASPGAFHWVLSDAHVVEPVDIRGGLSLWSLPDEYRHLFV